MKISETKVKLPNGQYEGRHGGYELDILDHHGNTMTTIKTINGVRGSNCLTYLAIVNGIVKELDPDVDRTIHFVNMYQRRFDKININKVVDISGNRHLKTGDYIYIRSTDGAWPDEKYTGKYLGPFKIEDCKDSRYLLVKKDQLCKTFENQFKQREQWIKDNLLSNKEV